MHKNKKHIYQFILIGLLLFLSGCGGSCDAPLECEPEFGAGGVRGVEWNFSRKGRTCVRDCSTRLFSLGEVGGGTKYSDWVVNNKTGEWTRTHVVEGWEENGQEGGTIFGDTMFLLEYESAHGTDSINMRILSMKLSENKKLDEYSNNFIPLKQAQYLEENGGKLGFSRWGTDSLFFEYWPVAHINDFVGLDSSQSHRWILSLKSGKVIQLDLNQIFQSRDRNWNAFGREREVLLAGVFKSDTNMGRYYHNMTTILFSENSKVDSVNIRLPEPSLAYKEMSLHNSRLEYEPLANFDSYCIDLDVPNRKTVGDWYTENCSR